MVDSPQDPSAEHLPVVLSNAALGSLPASVARPNYDRSELSPGIVHVGVGNFHRAHQAWYLHRLMQQGLAMDWAIIGAGVRPQDSLMRERLLAQDCLTTLIELDPQGISAEVIGSMIDFLPIEDGNGALIAMMADPRIRIVALTVTEGGYFVDPATGEFDIDHADIRHDTRQPTAPRTVFGAMVAALKLRRDTGLEPFAVQSCDNIQGNGTLSRKAVTKLASLSDPELAKWIETRGAFPNSMVDCIVPATGPKEIALAEKVGIIDAAPVTHENYRQWVIEDDFCAGRPDWDKVGATLTDDVHDFEAMKIRILNAGHQVLANVGELLSVQTIADCMDHPVIFAFFNKVQHSEIAPYVSPVPDILPKDYVASIAIRFSNRQVHDTTRRVAFDGSSRHTGFVLPILRDALAAGGPIDGLSLVEALWARMCWGTREDGSKIAPNDPFWTQLTAAATTARDAPRTWLLQSHIYGDLADYPRFSSAFEFWFTLICDAGSEAAITAYLDGSYSPN
ncbi:Mannitol 2-dehydrogenase [Shimia sp. SK013]|uniref:mannitol dehydrogenase family protein n=1 Tax=Shimia sp. SK013 TaxID=1389006 RepID=UPI0006B62ECC|nr:mannitol dehydrogenase family protein [Shimia sp. SK013]KPA21824.1 Mannitol 2-dehydrogenase [Shimia sp. SK013]